MRNFWTDSEKQYLREHYEKLSCREIGEHLGRTPQAVKQYARRIIGLQSNRFFTPDEMAIVRRDYPRRDTAEIAKEIDRSISSVYRIANKLGLKKDPDVLAEILKTCGQQFGEAGKAHRYPKGHVPLNKGLRRPGWAPGRMRETQFKKGSFSPNRREIGAERIDSEGYVYVKIADGRQNRNWKQKHWIVWEQHNGPMPEGLNIVFKDGNRQNCAIENLEGITDAELMSRNTFNNYPEPVKQQIHILAGFKRRLNSYAKKQDRRSA